VSVTRVGEDGRELELARLDDGDQFGELALLWDAPRNATVTCVTDCMFLALTREQFAELLDSTPQVRVMVEKVAAVRTTSMRAKNLAATLS
jgi:CRP-like cAMP-binding protein